MVKKAEYKNVSLFKKNKELLDSVYQSIHKENLIYKFNNIIWRTI